MNKTVKSPFARAFVPWLCEWEALGLTGTQERVLLLIISRMRRSGNMWVGNYRRKDAARVLNIGERAVSNAIHALTKKGVLKRLNNSAPGREVSYQIMPKQPFVTSGE